MKSILKTLFTGMAVTAATAVPAYYAYSQTTPTPTPAPTPSPTPTPSATTSSVPYIPLFVTAGGSMTGGTSTTATTGMLSSWFIDVAGKRIVMCTQTGIDTSGTATGATGTTGTTTTAGAAQNVNCTAQPLPG